MPRLQHSFTYAGLVLVVLVAACGKPPDQAAQQTPPVPATPAHMKDHFSKVREVEEAIIRGDLDAAKTPATWIADHEDASANPGTQQPIREMKAAAKSIASSGDLGNAAVAAATLVGACGSCHSAARVNPALPPMPERTPKNDRGRHMLDHQVAIERMYRGLVVPASGEWVKGAEALKVAPLRDKALTDITKEAVAAEARVHDLAERAVKAPDTSSRVAIYGSIIGACASCHGLHGRVWGPGLPKAD